VSGHVPPPNCQAITDLHGAHLKGANKPLGAVSVILVFQGLCRQWFPGLHDVAAGVEELLRVVLRESLNDTFAGLALWSAARDNHELHDSASLIPGHGERAERIK